MFGEKSLLQYLSQDWQRKKGIAIANDEVARFRHQHPIDSILKEREWQFRRHKGNCRNSPFLLGWISVWRKLGWEDAENGTCHYERYNNEWYDAGWWQRMEKMQQAGWVNPRLEAYLGDVIEHFKGLKSKGN
jgi:hypothetical protein